MKRSLNDIKTDNTIFNPIEKDILIDNSSLSNNINSRTEQEIYELKLGCGFKGYENVSDLQEVVDQHMRHDSNKVSKIAKFRKKSIREFKKKMNDIYHYNTDLTQKQREYMNEYYAYYTNNSNNSNNESNFKLNEINGRYESLGDKTILNLLKGKVHNIQNKMNK